jgi:hypothetical protein
VQWHERESGQVRLLTPYCADELMLPQNSPSLDVDGCFEHALADHLHLRRGTPIQEVISRYGRKLRWGFPERLAAALQSEFYQYASQVRHDERSVWTLEQRYTQVRNFVTPIYRLPAEILTEIFRIDFEGRGSAIKLMLVCQTWYRAVEGMTSIWHSLNLATWTPRDRVERILKMAGRLNVAIHVDGDVEGEGRGGEAYSALALVADYASRWTKLTIDSLPYEQHLRPTPSFASLSPIKGLNYLKVASQAESSPLLTQLLENIGTAAVGSLSIMETTSWYTLRHLAQPSYNKLFHFLTSLKAHVPKMGDLAEIDLLPHLSRIEVLELTNISLPTYTDEIDLPLIRTLRLLRLKAVPIHWMGGREFPQLRNCSIASPAIHSPLVSDIYFPICTELEFVNWNGEVEVAGQFLTPAIKSFTTKSNEWTPARGSTQVIQSCRVGLGIHWQPRALHLAVLCKERVLLLVLGLLPALEELRLDLARPCVLGHRFFMALLAKPTDDLKSDIDEGRDSPHKPRGDWKPSICPSLKILELKYERWLRQTDRLDILPPLITMGWSRQTTVTPLESFQLSFKAPDGQWKQLQLHTLQDHIEAFGIPQLRPFQLYSSFYRLCVTSTVTSIMEITLKHTTCQGLQRYFDLQAAFPVFGSSFRRLTTLRIYPGAFPSRSTFDFLPNFFRLEELALHGLDIPFYSTNVDLPFTKTLLRLSLCSTTFAWMDGRIFPRLKRLFLEHHPFGRLFSRTVSLPVCTHIKCDNIYYRLLLSAFHVPILDKLELRLPFPADFFLERDSEWATSRLLPTRFLRLRVDCIQPASLIPMIASLSDLEVLLLTPMKATSTIALVAALGRTITDIGVPALQSSNASSIRNAGTLGRRPRSLICPNLRLLGLQVSGDSPSIREEIRRQCKQMMDRRKNAGRGLERCCLWWDSDDWDEKPSLVLAMWGKRVVVTDASPSTIFYTKPNQYCTWTSGLCQCEL